MIRFLILCLLLIQNSSAQESQQLLSFYAGVTLPECGLRKTIVPKSEQCFKWHTTSELDEQMVSVGDGSREADDDEFPWTVLLYAYSGMSLLMDFACSGALLNHRWVITAAHCLDLNFYAWVYAYLGSAQERGTYTWKRLVRHPKYNKNNLQHDIALIQLKDSVPIGDDGHGYARNSICLPTKDYMHGAADLAVVAGWGHPSPAWYNFKIVTSRMRTGVMRFEGDSNDTALGRYVITACKAGGFAHIVPGDSGGPLFQYVRGRAVLIGVSRGLGKSTRCHGGYGQDSFSFVRVSAYVDWIRETILEDQ